MHGSTQVSLLAPSLEAELTTRDEHDIVDAFLSGRRATTLRAYSKDLADFSSFVQMPDVRSAIASLLAGSAGRANLLVLNYKSHLTDRALAPATIARRLASIRSIVKLARTLGQVTWTIDISSPRAQAYRDTRGPGLEGWRSLISRATDQAISPKAKRDLALVRLMHDLGLRRGEIIKLDLKDLDLAAGSISLVGKGKSEKSLVTLNPPTMDAVTNWVIVRGDWPGPLFVRLDRASGPGHPTRLNPGNAARASKALGLHVGIVRGANPHGLRHQGITRALDLTGGDIRRVKQFSRHARVETLLRYDDNRRDEAGIIARLLGEDR